MGQEKIPLLPRPLTGGLPADSLGSAIVTDADGIEMYRSPVQYQPTFAGHDTVEAMMGGMRVQVALRPDMASKLIIGGMPRDQRPRLLILLALTAVVVAGALPQLRPEDEVARLRAAFVSRGSPQPRTPLPPIPMFSGKLLLGPRPPHQERRPP